MKSIIYVYLNCFCDKYYKVCSDNLENAINQIDIYESNIYDLYANDDNDIWGWWNEGEYKQVNYEDIPDGEEINDLVNYKPLFPVKFCETFKKGDNNGII